MADQLNMNGLSLNDSHHANGMPPGRPAYIPPHLRGQPSRGGGAPPPDNMSTMSPSGYDGGLNASAWSNQG